MPLPSFASVLLTSLPDAETIRRKAVEVAARPEFQLDTDRDRESLSIWLRILFWLLTPIRWFLSLIEGLPDPLWWLIVIVLSATVVALLVHIVWSFLQALKGTPRKRFGAAASDPKASAEELERAAAEAEAHGDYIGAVRLWFRAGILRIERAEDKPIRRGITNHELLRRYRASPLFEPLQWFVRTIDSKWYGYDVCVAEDCLACRSEYDRICRLAVRRPHAVGA